MLIDIDEHDVIWEMDGKEYCTNEDAIAILLHENVLFANSRPYYDKFTDRLYPETVLLFVCCNDTFDYAAADADSITLSEIKDLFKLWLLNKTYGPVVWSCQKRKRQPLPELKKKLIELNLWTPELEGFEKHYYDKEN